MKTNKTDYTKPNFKGRRLIMGDSHGGFKAFKVALERANFDYDNDLLINLGDCCDGWSQSKEVIDELLKMKHLVYLLGNHDEWCLDYYAGDMKVNNKISPVDIWYVQGGESTIKSLGDYDNQDPKYLDFLRSGLLYYKIQDECEDLPIIFSHANIPNKMYNMDKLVQNKQTNIFIWERWLIREAARMRNTWDTVDDRFKEIYLGHSAISNLMGVEEHCWKPQKMTNIWGMDTNAAYDGKVSIMDIDTKEIYQSDFVFKYYPDERGRNKESYNEYLKRESL